MIRMRVNTNKESKCENCGREYKNTGNMIDLMLVNKENVFTLCRDCYNELFKKLLTVECMHNAKTKSPEDMERIRREEKSHMRKYLEE